MLAHTNQNDQHSSVAMRAECNSLNVVDSILGGLHNIPPWWQTQREVLAVGQHPVCCLGVVAVGEGGREGGTR